MIFIIISFDNTIEFDESRVIKRNFRSQIVRITSEIVEFIDIDTGEFVRDNLKSTCSFLQINLSGFFFSILRREMILIYLDLCMAKSVTRKEN